LDPLTHFLTGACVGRAGLNRKTALATAVLTISCEIADIDILYEINGPISSFQHHRGWTHTFLGVPVMAALAVAIVLAYDRWWWGRDKRLKARKLPVRLEWLYGFALLGGLLHILLDFTNSYGVRPFLPFNYRWYHWDIVNIVEPVMLLFLLAGLLMPKLFGLIQEEIGARHAPGRAWPIAALVLVAALWGLRDFEHRRAIGAMSSIEYGEGLPIRLSAFPAAVTPFTWYGVVENESSFVTFAVDTLKPEVDPTRRMRVWPKPEETEASLAAKRSRAGRVYLDWADYPYVTTEPIIANGGHRVTFLDLRYGYLSRTALATQVELDRELHVTGLVSGGYFHPRRLRPANE
jgi:inner membrane protein